MKSAFAVVLLLCATGSAVLGGDAPPRPAKSAAAPAPKEQNDGSGWVFSLLPKSFQKNPPLELTVITEMTEAGRKLPPVSPAQPAYFELHTPGPRHFGHAGGAGKTVPQEEIERVLLRSLAGNGYQPAQRPARPPSLLIVYIWGAHSLLTEGDEENPSLSSTQVAANLLDRAALIGGEKFAREMLRLFQDADAMNIAASATVAPSGESVFTPAMLSFGNPVNLFKARSAKNEFLVDQMVSDVFYVTASAYDYLSVARNQKQLLWRTRMTVAAPGVSQLQALPALVISAAPYFGKEMPEPEVLTRRVLREGSVEVGTPVVVEEQPAPAAAPKKK